MEATTERIDPETAEKLVWALEILNEKPKSCLTCGDMREARQKLVARALTADQIRILAECDRRAHVEDRSLPAEFASERTAGQLFDNCVRLEKFTEALQELAQE